MSAIRGNSGPARAVVRPGRRGVAVLLALGAVVFWIVFWIQTRGSVLTRVPVLDEAWYLRAAHRLTSGGLGHEPLVMSPLYTAIVAVLGAGRALPDGVLTGPAPWALLLVQALGWCAIGVLIGVAVLRLAAEVGVARRTGELAALGAAMLFWLYRPAAIYARTILLEIPLTLVVTGLLVILGGWLVRPPRRPLAGALAVGALLGLAVLLRAHTAVLVIPAAVTMVISSRGQRPRRRIASLAAMAATLLVTLLPAIAVNSLAIGRLSPPVLNGGVNLFLGNGPQARALFTTPAGLDLEHDPSGRAYLAARLGRPIADDAAANRLWLDEVAREVRAHPGRAVGLWLRKLWLNLQTWEISQVTPLHAWPRAAPILRVLVVPFALLVGLGLGGAAAVAAGPRRAASPPATHLRAVAGLWAGAWLLLIVTQSLVFVVTRYRLVLVPPLAVLAGLGALRLAPRVTGRDGRGVVWPASVVLAMILVSLPWHLGATRQLWRTLEARNEAVRYERWAAAVPAVRDTALVRSAALYDRAAAAEPGQPDVYLGLSRVRQAQGRPAEAVAILADGIRRVAAPEALQRRLIDLLLAQGQTAEARTQLDLFLRDHPRDADMLHNLTVLLGRTGRWGEAEAMARRLLAAAPQDPRGYVDLGVVLAGAGQRDAAIAILREGLDRWPQNADLRANLGKLGALGAP